MVKNYEFSNNKKFSCLAWEGFIITQKNRFFNVFPTFLGENTNEWTQPLYDMDINGIVPINIHTLYELSY